MAIPSFLCSPETAERLIPTALDSLSLPPAHLLLLLLLVLLGEEGVDPPDLGEHAAVGQAKAEAEEPQAELQERREEQKWSREGGMRGLGLRRGFSF